MTRRRFKPTKLHVDIARVVLKCAPDAIDSVEVFKLVFGGNDHYGWEVEMVAVMICLNTMLKRGLVGGWYDSYFANERTAELAWVTA